MSRFHVLSIIGVIIVSAALWFGIEIQSGQKFIFPFDNDHVETVHIVQPKSDDVAQKELFPVSVPSERTEVPAQRADFDGYVTAEQSALPSDVAPVVAKESSSPTNAIPVVAETIPTTTAAEDDKTVQPQETPTTVVVDPVPLDDTVATDAALLTATSPRTFVPSSKPVRGIFLSGWAAGAWLPEAVDYILQHDLNTIVIDIKDVDGLLSFALPGTKAQALGANARKMGGPERVRTMLRELKEAGIYVIGRLALFQDNFLAKARPQWALQTPDGNLWRDPAGGYWIDPSRPEVLDYNVEIAVAAAQLGFDEIQFDYIRYPSQRVPGYNDGPVEKRIETITRFAADARHLIQQQVDVPVSGAIYGIVAVNPADHYLGQNLNALSEALDYISPMFYPSHYLAGDFGLADPNAEPYKTIFASTAATLARTDETEWPRLRPWIQSFFGYEKEDIEAQVRALRDLGIDSFLVWNPGGRYVAGVDYHLQTEDPARLATSPFRRVLYPMLSPATGIFNIDPAFKFPAFAQGDKGRRWQVHGKRRADGFYRLELWEKIDPKELKQLTPVDPAFDEDDGNVDSDDGDNFMLADKRRLIALQRTVTQMQDLSLHDPDHVTFGQEDDGITVTWVEQGYEWSVWAPTAREALAAKRSLQTLPSPLFEQQLADNRALQSDTSEMKFR